MGKIQEKRERGTKTYAIVRKEDALHCRTFRKGDGVFVLTNFIPLDILNGIQQARHTVRTHRPVTHGQDVVSPTSARNDRCTLGPVHPHGNAEKGVYPHIVARRCHGNI